MLALLLRVMTTGEAGGMAMRESLASACTSYSAVTADSVGWLSALGFAGVAVMSGMAIMFGASAVNLRKLRPGFERLASGDRDPAIPPVWCPVLTMATRAAVDLSTRTTGQSAENNG